MILAYNNVFNVRLDMDLQILLQIIKPNLVVSNSMSILLLFVLLNKILNHQLILIKLNVKLAKKMLFHIKILQAEYA